MRRSRRLRLSDLPRLAIGGAVELAQLLGGRYAKSEGAHVLAVDDDGRILVVRTTYLGPEWMLPGGRVERHEAPEEAAVREVREETGLTVRVGRLRAVDARYSHGVSFVFDGRVTSGRVEPGFGEIAEAGWVSRDEIAVGSPRLSRLLDSIDAAGEGTAYVGGADRGT